MPAPSYSTFDLALDAFVAGCERILAANPLTIFGTKLEILPRRRWLQIRSTVKHPGDNQYLFAIVDMQTGNVHRPKRRVTYQRNYTVAKTKPSGNILEADNGLSHIGPYVK